MRLPLVYLWPRFSFFVSRFPPFSVAIYIIIEAVARYSLSPCNSVLGLTPTSSLLSHPTNPPLKSLFHASNLNLSLLHPQPIHQIFIISLGTMSTRRSHRSAATKAKEAIADVIADRVTRPRRTVSEKIATATVERGPPTEKSNSPESMRLTVKTSSNKLREATRVNPSPNTIVAVNNRDPFVGGEIVEGKRARNVRKSYVLESESDEDDEMEDVEDEDAEGDSVEEDDDEMDDVDEDADGDIDMDVPPPPPVIKISKARSGGTTIVAKPPTHVDHKTVEQKEVEAGSDDEELSDLESDIEDVDEEETMQMNDEEDAEGEDEEIEVELEEDVEDDEELDSDDETPGMGSRASTPDLNKLTKRQRARLEEGGDDGLMALPDGKHPSRD